jgi:hypothetical protein
MSAFIVGNDHIDGLLSFAISRVRGNVCYYHDDNRVEISRNNATKIGRILLAENERSVCHRYNEASEDEASSYTFKPWHETPNPVSILKACDCFDYQACETEDYEKSEAHTIIMAIRKRAISALPGYDNAPGWELRRVAR